MRQEETKFLELLGNLPKSKLLSPVKFKDFREEKNIVGDFELTVTRMVNSFSFSKKEVLEVIVEEKKLSDSFLILSLHYIKQCNDKWRNAHWDSRDMASIKMCRDIVACSEFSDFYAGKCRNEHGIWEYSAEDQVYSEGMLLGVKLIHGIYTMHPTNRQTLAGLVLSFYANSPKMEKLSKAGHKAMGLPYHEDVRFMMV